MRAIFSACFLLLTSIGCTNYDYDITRPAEFAARITAKADTTVSRETLIYRFRAVESRLVISIENPTDDPVQLIGDRSTVVDFSGQSHPIQSRTAAAHSFVKLILPPMRPTIQREGPTFGIGVGGVIGTRDRVNRGMGDDPFLYNDFPDERPQYFAVIDPDDAVYWEWNGEGEIRLSLVYESNGKNLTHEWVIRRVKA